MNTKRANPQRISPLNASKIQKYLIILNRDTGQLIPTQATTPIEFVPFGFSALPYSGTKKQMESLINKFKRKPYLLEKYTDR